jgi:hypothetical protein
VYAVEQSSLIFAVTLHGLTATQREEHEETKNTKKEEEESRRTRRVRVWREDLPSPFLLFDLDSGCR